MTLGYIGVAFFALGGRIRERISASGGRIGVAFSPQGRIGDAFYLNILPASAKTYAYLESFLHILTKLLCPHLHLMFLIEAGHVVLAVIRHLQGIAAGVSLY